MAMMADAISHSVLPGIVAAFLLARGPNLLAGFIGAAAAGLLTVFLVETLSKSKRVSNDSAIGLVFPALFALGVLVISTQMANVHIDTDAVLYGEIAFAPFDPWMLGDRNMGPQSLWILLGLGLMNLVFLVFFYKELKLTTFDSALAATFGFSPVLIHYLMTSVVAITTVGAFSAVGAILAVSLIVVPSVTASLLTRRLGPLILASVGIGAFSAGLGYWFALLTNVSVSGMIGTTQGALFVLVFLAAPRQGLVAQILRRRRQARQFDVDMLVMHLATHSATPQAAQESTLLHIERELGWTTERVSRAVDLGQGQRLFALADGGLRLEEAGRDLSKTLISR